MICSKVRNFCQEWPVWLLAPGHQKPTYATASPLRWRRSFLTTGLVSHYFRTDTDSFHYGTKQYVWNLRVTRHHSPFPATLSTKSVIKIQVSCDVTHCRRFGGSQCPQPPHHNFSYTAVRSSNFTMSWRPSTFGWPLKARFDHTAARELFPWSARMTPCNKEPGHRPRVSTYLVITEVLLWPR
jgi:hypothetical protein